MARTKRIGALLPATNPVVEPDFYRVIPGGVTVHFERMWNGRWGGQPGAAEDEQYLVNMSSEEANTVDWALFGFDVSKMNDDVVRGARSLANIGPTSWCTPAPRGPGTGATWTLTVKCLKPCRLPVA